MQNTSINLQDINIDIEIHACVDKLKSIRLKNTHNVIVGNLNINSLRYKFDQLKLLIADKIDILVLTEAKLDETFPSSQFTIEGYSMPYRLYRDKNEGGVLIYIKENIGSKV